MAGSRDYLEGTAAAISAIYDLTGFEGSCALASISGREARFELRWQEP